MDCSKLDDDSHAVLRAARIHGISKKGWARTTPDRIAEDTKLHRTDVRLLLADLEVDGFVDFQRENSALKLHHECWCPDPLAMTLPDPLGSGAERRRTEPKRSVGEGSRRAARSWTSSEGQGTTRAIVRDGAREADLGLHPERADIRPRPARTSKSEKARLNALDKPVAKLTAWDLTAVLVHKLREANRGNPHGNGWAAAGAVNFDAMRGHFARWMREEGASPEHLYAMIEVFVGDPRYLRGQSSTWKAFVNSRAKLAELASNRNREALAGDDLGWLESAADLGQDDDDDLGWGTSERATT